MKWFPIGLALLVVPILPNLLWGDHHQWATLELLHNDQINGKNVRLGPIAFALNQMVAFGLLMAPLWVEAFCGCFSAGRLRRSASWA